MKGIIFKLFRESTETNAEPQLVFQRNRTIDLFGEYYDIFERNPLKPEMLALIIINEDSINQLKKQGLEKSDILNKYVFPIFGFKTKEDWKKWEDAQLNVPEFITKVDLLFGNSIFDYIREIFIAYTLEIMKHSWRSRLMANWENIVYLLDHSSETNFQFHNIICIKKDFEKIVILFPRIECLEIYFDLVRIVKIDGQNFNESENQNSSFMGASHFSHHDFIGALSYYFQNLNETLDDYFCMITGSKYEENPKIELENKVSQHDRPFLDFIGNLIPKDWKVFENVIIERIEKKICEIKLDFDIVAKKNDSKQFIFIELKQLFEREKITSTSEFIQFCGRIFYFDKILKDEIKEDFKIYAFFITTGKCDSKSFEIGNNIKFSIICEENLDAIFNFESYLT